MKKSKYLDRKVGRRSTSRSFRGNLGHGRDNQIPLDELPFRESMRTRAHKQDVWFGEYRYQYNSIVIDKFLMSKVGQKWDDVYSELFSKIKDKNKWLVKKNMYWFLETSPIYIDGIPYYSRFYRTYPLYNKLFVDRFGYLRYFETIEKLEYFSKQVLRKLKLRRIFG